MASLIQGFEYDIFISYRQKDNRHDGWVTEFVNNLKGELESTFKEEISVYLDINQHDGLLETHDVDASLKDKLKCLVFIPVISRTYCDPNSFAWAHEFVPFVETTQKDQFGLKVNLPNGNVASRVIPVRIHDLDISDIKLCETLLGGVLRGVDFIYRSAGVNRPLRANEDRPNDNLNKTYYRDQINKLANAIDEIIDSLKNIKEDKVNTGDRGKEYKPDVNKGVNKKGKLWMLISGKNSKKRSIVLLMIFLLVLGVFSILKITTLSGTDKTTALILFQNEINDSTLNENADILLDAIREKLQNVKRVALTPRISCEQYRNTKKPINTILNELHADNLVAGSVGRESNKTIIRVELIKAKASKPAWFKKYPLDRNQIMRLSNEIVLDITSKLYIVLSSEEKNKIERSPTNNDEAYQNLLTANGISNDAWLYYNMGNKLLDSTSFISAIKTYDKAIKKDSLFALAYAKRAIARSWGYSIHQLDQTHIAKCREDIDKALKIDKDLTEAQIALGFYFYYCKGDYENALKYFKIAADQDPENYQPMFFMAIVYRKMGEWEKSQNLMHKVVRLNPQEALFLTNIGTSYDYARNFDSALIYHQKAIDILPGWADSYKNKIETYLIKSGNTAEARIELDSAIRKTGENFDEYKILLSIYERKFKDAFITADRSLAENFDINGYKYIYLARISNFLNNPTDAGKYYDSALVVLNRDQLNNPKNPEIRSSIAIVYAGKGYKEKALKEGKYAIDLTVKNEPYKSDLKVNLAEIYTIIGEYDNAIKIIEELLNTPSRFSIKFMQLDPLWEPLFIYPQFKSLIKKYSKN